MLSNLDLENTRPILALINGLLLSGGLDVSPIFYGHEPKEVGKINPERDRFEIEFVRLAYRRRIPILAICRGIQVLNVALGGTLKQKVKGIKHFQDAERHQVSHSIVIEKGSLFHRITGRKRLMVNSFHRDGVDLIGPRLKATGWSQDGLVEVLEAKDNRFLLGVQFHPECLFESYPWVGKIFRRFIEAAKKIG